MAPAAGHQAEPARRLRRAATPASFEAELPKATQRAIFGFTERGRPSPPPGGYSGGSGRPSLRGDPAPGRAAGAEELEPAPDEGDD
ncbi:hypothetical protein EDD99_3187 [Streptomyces sp. 846.5]|nr:hypothetical protein [Streptomyces sp. 846.5]TDU04712.1 hypothetical protein EDD99_3187 [Streptomyces sp. 846.5]